MKYRLALSLVFLMLLGCMVSCTNGRSYGVMLDNWIGRSEKELVMGWGIPDKQYQLDQNTKMISYTSSNTAVYPGALSSCFGTGRNNAIYSNCAGLPSMVETYYCETIFTIISGRVSRWGHKGNNCRG